ncbi:hypothetical protein AMAG_08362 [Allomyces macrogynus ATCC 38327]|uniref:MPN domain-containing protein n=1 Tax=Allomyces macrogynus (strain ATCC 38327) TaxID=578462 RepID=A0A0L0SLF1_ALLM3|nr:Eukaryotic translation initiation factor 3 subunit H [Allomyces arbusculus]KNE62228.1 hypothetical protein AMAG_07468 [Allomyces macrogynus ATCC 38327]KNE63214.1 hypothetical protein AMAG_08362 [Allomyces macrogynus ATCC 38327]|eukprot:KNE62228.1 hypothetical protein AMAG_07468 [Allomyces macrogynus ATCC 38327]
MASKNVFAALAVDQHDDDYLGVSTEPVTSVQVDALVALKIAKHAKDLYPAAVTGALLGMDIDGVLEVTQSYPYLAKARRGRDNDDNDDDAAELDEHYQVDMLKCLRQVNADANTVGWYHAAPLSHFLQYSWVANQAEYQTSIPQSVVLEYDPLASQTGTLALRAFRLTDAFYALLKAKSKHSINSEAVTASGLLESGLIEELPVTIRNAHVVSALLYSQNLTAHSIAAPMPGVDRSTYVAKHANALLETLDDLAGEHARYAGWHRAYTRDKARMDATLHRKRQENPAEAEALAKQLAAKLPNEPSKVDSLLLSHQAGQHCELLDAFLAPAVLSVETARVAVGAEPAHE